MSDLTKRFEFDSEYLNLLRNEDVLAANHFASHFSRLLTLKLRARVRDPQLIEDVRQETLRRVLETVRNGELQDPSRLAPFVCSVCNHVLLEYWRAAKKHQTEEQVHEPVSVQLDPEQTYEKTETSFQVRRMLRSLPARDREVINMVFFEELDNLELSIVLKVSRAYARVLVHRALRRLRESFVPAPASHTHFSRTPHAF